MLSFCWGYKDEHEQGGAQVKGGYMLRYKRKFLWASWSEEWVVLYDDSTMAWFKDASGKRLATQKHLVKECPEMLAISTWTGQVPWRPQLPRGAHVSQLMALGSRRKPSDVIWMLAKSDDEMKFDFIGRGLFIRSVRLWPVAPRRPPPPVSSNTDQRTETPNPIMSFTVIGEEEHRDATGEDCSRRVLNDLVCHILPTASHAKLPPPPHIELVIKMPYLRTALKRPLVVVRPSKEVKQSRSRNGVAALDGRGLVAVIKRQVPLAGKLEHELAWGQGWGWVTLPNGVWSGRLVWSNDGGDFTLHAMPFIHHTNVYQACYMLDGVQSFELNSFDQGPSEYDDTGTDDWDVGVDCGDFMM